MAKSQSAVLYIVRSKSATKSAFQTGYGMREIKEFGKLPTRENAAHFTERVPVSYACCGSSKGHVGTHLLCLLPTQNKERTGKEWKGSEQSKTGKSL